MLSIHERILLTIMHSILVGGVGLVGIMVVHVMLGIQLSAAYVLPLPMGITAIHLMRRKPWRG